MKFPHYSFKNVLNFVNARTRTNSLKVEGKSFRMHKYFRMSKRETGQIRDRSDVHKLAARSTNQKIPTFKNNRLNLNV